MTKPQYQSLLIIDFGSQVTKLIARRLRELNIFCEVHPYQRITEKFLTEFKPKAIIFSGSPKSVNDENNPKVPLSIFRLGLPILGICYGQQLMMHQLGGHVEGGIGTAEFGPAYLSNERNLKT